MIRSAGSTLPDGRDAPSSSLRQTASRPPYHEATCPKDTSRPASQSAGKDRRKAFLTPGGDGGGGGKGRHRSLSPVNRKAAEEAFTAGTCTVSPGGGEGGEQLPGRRSVIVLRHQETTSSCPPVTSVVPTPAAGWTAPPGPQVRFEIVQVFAKIANLLRKKTIFTQSGVLVTKFDLKGLSREMEGGIKVVSIKSSL